MLSAIPWVLSAWTLGTMWMAGNKSQWAWVSGMASQGLWAVFAVSVEAWGLLPLPIALSVIYARNLRKWRAAC